MFVYSLFPICRMGNKEVVVLVVFIMWQSRSKHSVVSTSASSPAQTGSKPVSKFRNALQLQSGQQSQLYLRQAISFLETDLLQRNIRLSAKPFVGDQSSQYLFYRFL